MCDLVCSFFGGKCYIDTILQVKMDYLHFKNAKNSEASGYVSLFSKIFSHIFPKIFKIKISYGSAKSRKVTHQSFALSYFLH